MNNDKNLEIKKKPQQVTEEDLNNIAGGGAKTIEECDTNINHHKKGHC